MKLIKEITFASIVSVLLMMPFGSVFSDNWVNPEPENNTIPLWGPTWCKDTITWQISNADKISDSALTEMEAGIAEWANHVPDGVTLIEFDPIEHDSPDMVLKFKRGGGQVQGQALQRSDNDGCFINVKINVSGQAFGQANPGDQVKSITIQEVGHGLGLLHSDKTSDVMFGTVQEQPNVLLSECDITAWEAVMHWLVEDNLDPIDAHIPHVDSVTCNETDPGEDPGSPNPNTIDITNGHDHGESNQSKDDNYSNRQTVHIFVNTDVSGADVHVEIDAPKSTLSGDTTTDENGIAHIHYKVNAGRDGSGDYHIFATVTSNGQTLSCEHEPDDTDADSCLAHFSVS